MERLSPFQIAPYFRTRIWGFRDLAPWFDFQTKDEPIGEVWLTGDQCAAATGPLKGASLDEITRNHREALLGQVDDGTPFPLLIKVLFPKEKLSVQVHPDDAMARKYGEPRGKTECWYALDTAAGAQVALGIRPGIAAEAVKAAIEDSTLEGLLSWLDVQKGDMIFVDAGTVHAIGPGSVLLETQQNSDLTYRMYDYGRPRELHVDLSMEAMRLSTRAGKVAPIVEDGHTKLIDEEYFRIDRFDLSAGAGVTDDSAGTARVLFVEDGDVILRAAGMEALPLRRCEAAIVPVSAGEWSATSGGTARLIRITPQKGANL